MEHFNSKIILLVVLMSMVGTNVSAADIAVDNTDGVTIYYNFINDATELEVTEVPNNGVYTGTVVIPESVIVLDNTLKVTKIGNEAFYKCYDLSSVTIPNGVKTIGENAFNDCRGLTTVTIPQSVIVIDKNAFNACTGLTSVTIEDAATSIGVQAFKACTNLTSVELGNNVTSIGDRAFSDCDKLPSITIPNSVTSIGDWAFHCSSLLEVISFIKTPNDIAYAAFSDEAYKHGILYVPIGTLELYKACEGWKRFLSITEMTSDNVYLTLKDAATGCMKLLVNKGESYTFAIEPEDGWKVTSVTYNDEDVTSSLDEQNHFTTPAITADAVLRVAYSQDTKIASVANDNVNILAVSGGVWIEGATKDSVCQVFATDGKLLKSIHITNSRAFVNLNEGQVYIVKVGDKTLKAAL